MKWTQVLAASLLTATVSIGADNPLANAPTPAAAATAPVKVRLVTQLGPIDLAIDTARAPLTAANFLRYVNQKRFDGSEFYRAMKIGDTGEYGLLQGGLRGNPKKILKPIAHEPTNVTGLSHVSGAVSMARAAPGTATADFFIVLGDLVSLDAIPGSQAADPATDAGYAVFGKVVAGMDLVKTMLELPRSTKPAATAAMQGQMLAQPVKIVTARVVETTAP
jgi:peptidyl-prolyl cis-trans isomerase A (cyclophilin A)